VNAAHWALRPVPTALADRYRHEGHWNDDTLGSMVAAGLQASASHTFAVHSAVRPWAGTFAQVDRAARCLAASLSARGVGVGDVIAIQLPNWLEAGVSFWAAAYVGATVVPIVHFYGPREVDYIISATSPAVVVCPVAFAGVDYLGTYQPLTKKVGSEWLVVGSGDQPLPSGASRFEDWLDAAPIAQPNSVDPDLPAVVGFTSGTTRDPKGVIHTHRSICCETRQLDGMFPRGGPEQITGAPVGHFIGMLNAFLIPLLRERPVHLVDTWDPGRVLELMARDGLGVTGGATYFITSLLDHPEFTEEHLSLMPFAGMGGSPVPLAVTERLAGLGVACFRSYGSTEHPSITGCQLDEPEEKRLATDGRPLPGVEIRLDETGEILSRGPDCFLGYLDPDLTAVAVDGEGWYRTGDVGVLDSDGYLTITDRVADVIIRGGENVSAAEVEELLMGIDAIAEVAVVAEPDSRLGERVAAVIRLRPGAKTPEVGDLRNHLATKGLARQKWPESIHLVDDFPRTASGKIQKFRLRERLRGTGDPGLS
jgi:acyl-CoA synthetase (AMP-forming)/AMP-acid ligase II